MYYGAKIERERRTKSGRFIEINLNEKLQFHLS